jgi:formamidopyrimidine-DNA glycosylase
MPELPEVETVRRGLQQNVVGRKILKVEVGRERTVRRTSREALIDRRENTFSDSPWQISAV